MILSLVPAGLESMVLEGDSDTQNDTLRLPSRQAQMETIKNCFEFNDICVYDVIGI